ncbi:ankyrin repeat domain-containing protein [Pseudomonas sp. TKO26]|uniref:ankyrin repeat domain-containing protein n=1 Tax=unclassified Pseudomonas TaxID=196821 RepID=UPI000D83F2B0|nr:MULTISPECIES: ankyrin repeat domain-containing protein [unclassified Pseudomonas]PYY86468.1 ankyrin repeat domain-containing protein [Pseudomonas sp. TKO30]PYY89219.1 ankyrin repeat domain-containing protein [Pseudomonas sp. TKO29]PYY91892.1 ankyrin repeat domain-containing protein [Pseudomonas sp. TKO26]PYZ00002.1 ankyrin repeat domain-containing protein [Pseudomonas sp. TKO14]
MKLFSDTARRLGLHGLGLALLVLTGAPAVQAFDLDLAGIKWSGMARSFVLDYPETATLQIKPFPVPGLAQVPARIVLSQYRGLFYLNAYQDLKYQQRVYKSPPIALFSPEELRACAPTDTPLRVSDHWPPSNELDTGLTLTPLDFDCSTPSDWQLSQRYLLIDQRDPQHPLLAISHRQDLSQMTFTPLQPISEDTGQQWLQALQTFPRWFRPFTQGKGPITLNAYASAASPESIWKEFRALHEQLRSAKDKRPGIRQVEDFFAVHDVRSIATERREYPGLLNDIAYWSSEAGQLQTARPWLKEVLRRDPGRMPTYLNLADLDWAIYQQRTLDNIHQGRAIEGYRVYCGLRLQRQMSIPPRVLQRLGLNAANPRDCQAFWPLVDAVDAGDLAEVQRLLASGVSGEVMADDGRSALLHALDAPRLDIARLLLEHGAHTSGLYNWTTLATLAMRRDLGDSPDLSQGGRLKFLIESGVAVDEPDSQGVTPLMQMAENKRSLQGFSWLLKYPQNLDLRTARDGETALYQAFSGSNYEAVQQLIAAGANLNLSYGRGTCYNQPVGESLLTLVADKTAADAKAPYVSQQDTLALFTLLLEKGADPTVGQHCEKKGYTLLLEAIARNKREDMLQVLQRYVPTAPAG